MLKLIKTSFKRAFQFSGRALREEFVAFNIFFSSIIFLSGFLIRVLVGMAVHHPAEKGEYALVIGSITMAQSIFGLICLVPAISLLVRRHHDTGRSGWMALTPIAASLFAFGFGAIISGMMHSGKNYHKSIDYNIGVAILIFLATFVYMMISMSIRDSNREGDKYNPKMPSGPGLFTRLSSKLRRRGETIHLGEAIRSVEEKPSETSETMDGPHGSDSQKLTPSNERMIHVHGTDETIISDRTAAIKGHQEIWEAYQRGDHQPLDFKDGKKPR
jgi:uncharacterized membrane protein YhaH (DUF805 family)